MTPAVGASLLRHSCSDQVPQAANITLLFLPNAEAVQHRTDRTGRGDKHRIKIEHPANFQNKTENSKDTQNTQKLRLRRIIFCTILTRTVLNFTYHFKKTGKVN